MPVDRDRPGSRVEARHTPANQRHAIFLVEPAGAKGNPLVRRSSSQVILGEIRPIAGRAWIVVHDCNATVIAAPAQHFRSGVPGRARTDDDDVARQPGAVDVCGIARREGVALDLAGHDDLLAATLDRPARDRIQRRRPQRLARAQAETGVVPWTAYGLAVDHAVREGSAVVRAASADGHEITVEVGEEDRFLLDVTEQLVSGTDTVRVDSDTQIGTARLGHLVTRPFFS